MATPNLPFVPSSTKRHRTSSQSSGPLSDSSANVNFKSTRISTSPPSDAAPISEGTAVGRAPSHRLICTLPPTCNRRPTPLGSTKELESHYATYHAHVCEEAGCGCVFPEPRLLELHQTENHDPLAALRKERGEKIFVCHLATCLKAFMTPKARRLHLISAHGYPKEYFFAVTNKGVGGLLKKWGEGASMIRGAWKARDDPKPTDGPKKGSSAAMEVDSTSYRDSMDVDQEDDSSDESSDDHDHDHDRDSEGETNTKSKQPHTRLVPLHNDNRMALDPEATPRLHPSSKPLPSVTPPTKSTPLQPSADADGLAAGFSSLSLVPPSVRFGRGGRSTGFVSRSERRPEPQPDATPTPAQSVNAQAASAKRGRGGGGPNRGRGGAKVPNATESTPAELVHAESIERGRGRGRGATSRGRGAARGA